jgi:chromosome segregation ATPase
MINDVEDAAQIARAAADQALATAANALDPEKEVTKEDLIAAIKVCTIVANKASADADAAQAKAKAIESGLNIANATVAMANAATAQALAREKESSGKVKRFEISLTTAYAHIGALTNQLQQLEEAAAAAEARLVNSSSDTFKQNKPTVSSEGVQTQEDESAALQQSQTEGTSSAFFDESSGQHHNQMRIHGDSHSRPSSAPLGRHPLQMQPKMIASALPQMQQKLAQAQREKAIAEGDVERLAAILNEARTRIHHLEKVVTHLNTTSAQQQVVINAFEQQQRQQQELDYDALEGTGGPMLMSQSGTALTRPGTAIRSGTAKGSIPAASHQKSGVEMLNLMTRVTERDKMKKELVKAQKHASSLEKVVFSLKKELQAAGEEVRTLQREKMLLENQMSLLESRIDEFRSMLRASNRVQQQQQQQHQQQQQGGFGASSIVGGHRPLQSQQFRPPSAMMSRPFHSHQIFHSSPPVHQQISIQVSESAGFADESQVLGESHAVGIDEGTSKE